MSQVPKPRIRFPRVSDIPGCSSEIAKPIETNETATRMGGTNSPQVLSLFAEIDEQRRLVAADLTGTFGEPVRAAPEARPPHAATARYPMPEAGVAEMVPDAIRSEADVEIVAVRASSTSGAEQAGNDASMASLALRVRTPRPFQPAGGAKPQGGEQANEMTPPGTRWTDARRWMRTVLRDLSAPERRDERQTRSLRLRDRLQRVSAEFKLPSDRNVVGIAARALRRYPAKDAEEAAVFLRSNPQEGMADRTSMTEPGRQDGEGTRQSARSGLLDPTLRQQGKHGDGPLLKVSPPARAAPHNLPDSEPEWRPQDRKRRQLRDWLRYTSKAEGTRLSRSASQLVAQLHETADRLEARRMWSPETQRSHPVLDRRLGRGAAVGVIASLVGLLLLPFAAHFIKIADRPSSDARMAIDNIVAVSAARTTRPLAGQPEPRQSHDEPRSASRVRSPEEGNTEKRSSAATRQDRPTGSPLRDGARQPIGATVVQAGTPERQAELQPSRAPQIQSQVVPASARPPAGPLTAPEIATRGAQVLSFGTSAENVAASVDKFLPAAGALPMVDRMPLAAARLSVAAEMPAARTYPIARRKGDAADNPVAPPSSAAEPIRIFRPSPTAAPTAPVPDRNPVAARQGAPRPRAAKEAPTSLPSTNRPRGSGTPANTGPERSIARGIRSAQGAHKSANLRKPGRPHKAASVSRARTASRPAKPRRVVGSAQRPTRDTHVNFLYLGVHIPRLKPHWATQTVFGNR